MPLSATAQSSASGTKPYFEMSPKPYVAGEVVHFRAMNIPASGIQFWVVKHNGRVKKIENNTSELMYTPEKAEKYAIAVVYFTTPDDRSMHSLTRWITVQGSSISPPPVSDASSSASSSASKKEKRVVLWGKQTKGWGMKNAETTGNRLTLERSSIIADISGESRDYCIWLAVTPTNLTARSILCGGENRPDIVGKILQPGTYTVLPEAGSSVTVELQYHNGFGTETEEKNTHAHHDGSNIKEKPPKVGNKPPSAKGDSEPVYRLVVHPQKNRTLTSLVMKAGEEKRFIAWLEDKDGNKKSTTVKEWIVSDQNIGSISNDGLFRAGTQEGNVKITAKAINRKGELVKGSFLVAVASASPITFTGQVKLYDENGNRLHIPSKGVPVDINYIGFKDKKSYLDAINQPAGISLSYIGEIRTNRKGEFSFSMASGGYSVMSCNIPCLQMWAPPGYEWLPYPPVGKGAQNPQKGEMWNSSDWDGNMESGRVIKVSPGGSNIFKSWLTKRTNYIFIAGIITHRGNPVTTAHVKLINSLSGNSEKDDSDYAGFYSIGVDALPKGSYQLIAEYKSKKHVTVHNWLTIKKNIRIELPLKGTHTNVYGDEVKTVNIEMISQAEKMGYVEPGIVHRSVDSPQTTQQNLDESSKILDNMMNELDKDLN